MKFKSLLENKWWQEIIILIFSFILFTLNDWILIFSWRGFYSGLVYFFILYSHAQINRYFLLPILLIKHRPVFYFLMTILLLFVFSVILYEVSTEFLYKNCFLYKSAHQKSYQFQVATLVGTLICILGPILMLENYRIQKKRTNKKLLYNQVQLNALKGQLNPHFLFNTFNTLYGISLKYPERTSDMIMKVSQLMRYQVENGNKEFVSLQDELEFISSYIELEKERVGYRCDISFQQDVDFESNYKIAPMLLITFIENAFKHGACTIENCYVNIKIKTSEEKIYLVISNSIPTKKKTIVSTKIGLKNTLERLSILYPEKHLLTIKDGELKYEVNLEIDLN